MNAVDTSVLVRLILGDVSPQTAAAETFAGGGAWASQVSLAGTAWVLRSRYKLDAGTLAAAVEWLADRTPMVLENADAVRAALALFRQRPRLGFTDCLLLEQARAAGHLPFGTFDRELAKAPGAKLL